MKINYRLEVHYFGTDENGNKIDRYDNFIFDKQNSIENRKLVINEYENYSDIFNDAVKFGKLKLNWEEVIGKSLTEYHIPSMNIYYSEKEFNENNEDVVLFGILLESFEERIEELQDELNFYKANKIEFEKEIITDQNNNEYQVIKGSLISENDQAEIKNVC